MARVTPQDVAHVAKLACLSLTEAERDLFTRQLGEVLDYADSLSVFDDATTPAAAHAAPPALRPDEPRPGLPHESVLEAAPDPSDGLFRVPRVLPG